MQVRLVLSAEAPAIDLFAGLAAGASSSGGGTDATAAAAVQQSPADETAEELDLLEADVGTIVSGEGGALDDALSLTFFCHDCRTTHN